MFLKRGFIILLSFLSFASILPAIASNQIVAVINDTDIITQHDIEQRARFILLTTGKNPLTDDTSKLREEVLKLLVSEKLKLQEARRLRVTIRDEEINTAFDHIAQQNELSADAMKGILQKAGVHPQTFMDKLKVDLAWSRVAQYIVQTKITITEDEVQQAMAEHQDGASKEQVLTNISNSQKTNEEKTKNDTAEKSTMANTNIDTTKLREQIRKDLLRTKLEEAAKSHLEELHENALIDYRKLH